VLRLLAEIAVAHCLGSELPLGGPRPGALNFIAVDSFVRLLCTLIRCAPRLAPRLFRACSGRAAPPALTPNVLWGFGWLLLLTPKIFV
jgi:hypothetical protein